MARWSTTGNCGKLPVVERIQTALVDDHPLFRQGLREVLAREHDLQLVGDVGSVPEANELAKQRKIDVMIVDLVMPPATGVECTAAIKQLQPTCRVLGLSALDEPTRIAQMLRAGADGYALKTQPPEEIVGAIRTVMDGMRYLPPSVSEDQILDLIGSEQAWPIDRLTQREREVFDLLVGGHSNDSVATTLAIARRTVETHRQHIMKKLKVRSLVELIRLAMKHGVTGNACQPST